MTGPGSLAHVLGRLGVIEERIRHLVAARRADDPAPDDPFRGLYLSDEAVDRLLVGPRPPPDWTQATDRMEPCEAAADAAEDAGAVLRLRDLARDLRPRPGRRRPAAGRPRRRRRPPVRVLLRLPQRRRQPAAALGRRGARARRRAADVDERPRPPAPRAARGRWSGRARRARPAVPGPRAAGAGPRRVVPAGRRRAGPRAGAGDRHRPRRAVGRPVAPGARARRRASPWPTCASRPPDRGGCSPPRRCG